METGGSPRRRGRSAAAWPAALLLLALLPAACWIPRWPVDGTVTSPFGVRVEGRGLGLHRGVDVSVPVGTEVRSMAPGRVRYAGTMSGYGQVVWIDHGPDVLSVYAHLSQLRVELGDDVDGGTVVGLSGRSGNATGAHLHFEVWRGGREVDPVTFLGGFPGL